MNGRVMPIEQQVAAAHRELQMRKLVYPKQVDAGRMNRGKASHELAAMEAIAGSLEWLRDNRETIVAEVKARKTGGAE